MSLSDATLLSLTRTGFAMPEWAARGIQMTMAPIDASGDIETDVNGNLVDLSIEAFRKYKFNIQGSDVISPGFAAQNIWPGMVFELTCIPELGANEGDSEPQTFSVMLLSPGWQTTRDEWGAVTGWTMDFQQT